MLLVVACVLVAAIVELVRIVTTSRASAAASPGCTVVTGGTSEQYALTTDQAQNAAIIAAVAFRQGLPDHAVTIALAASLQESRLQNLPYGDRDSVGLFQQRPSQGWGTQSQLLDPSYATSAFYGRLVQVPGWQTMAVTDAAQAVQQSATPLAYASWESEARTLAVVLTGESAGGFSCRFDTYNGAAPPPTALGGALTTEMGADLLGQPVGTKAGWQLAAWAVAHACNYHLRGVSFAGLTWTPSTGKWTPSSATTAGNTVVVQGA